MIETSTSSSSLDRHLRWMIVIRLVVVSSVLLSYLVFELSSRGELPGFNVLFVIVAATYVASALYILLLRWLSERGVLHAYIQFAGDLLLVTGLVYFFGGITSPFSMLYLVDIIVAAVVLQRRAGLTVAGISYIAYAALLAALARGWLPALSPLPSSLEISWRISYNLAVHLFGFFAVALLTSYLAANVERAEEELAAKSGSLANLEVFHRDVIQSISSGLISTDLEGRVTSVNRAALEILGASEPALIGRSLEESGLFPSPEWRAAANLTRLAEQIRSESLLQRDGREIPVGFTVSRLTDAEDVPTGWIIVFQDLSQWRRLQEELRLKDRMAAVGELAAGLAHEVGNPLAAISGSVQLLSSSVGASGPQRRLLEIIVKESQRLDRTIKGFLRFAKPKERSTVRFDIAALIGENTALLRNSEEATGKHRFHLDLEPKNAQMLGDPDQISQIFWNLARNALRAMPDGGTLEIHGRPRGDSYRIEFRDTGHGMTEEQRTMLFQPFKTSFDGGTGIGMAIVYRIVQEHGGTLSVESRPQRGTVIAVELPAHREAASALAASGS